MQTRTPWPRCAAPASDHRGASRFAICLGLALAAPLCQRALAQEQEQKGGVSAKVVLAYLDLGRQKFEGGDYTAAITAFTKAQQIAPRDARPLYLRGAVYQKMNRPQQAEADFRAALQIDPKLSDVRAELGAMLTDGGRPQEAVTVLQQAVAQDPKHFEAHYNLGMALEALGRYAEAAQVYGQAAVLHPQDADVRLNQASALRKSGKLDEALVAARAAVRLAPDDAQAHLNLGLLLSESKRPDEAVAELQAATRLQPGSMKAWWRLGVVYLRKNQIKEALEALQRARAIKPSKEVLSDLGLAQRKQGDLKQAEASFRAALQQDGKYYPAWIYLADTIADGGRCKEALKELEVVPLQDEFREAVHRVQARCQFTKTK